MKKSKSGFTIVELLIVIVVIAILAAITIVAYNGIQQRARNTQVISGVNTYVKALQSYKVLNSSYPATSSCLGAGYPSDTCWSGTNGTKTVNTAFDTALATILVSKPTLATALMSIGGGDDKRAGAAYDASATQIIYYLGGAGQNCQLSGATAATEGNVVTQCRYTLPS